MPQAGTAREARVFAVIPAYQAESTIEAVLRDFAPHVDEVVVVDDGSEDGTSGRVRKCGLENVRLLRHEKNRGVGGALKTGIREALEGEADIVVKVDADGQMRSQDLAALLAPLLRGEADCAKGNRWHDRQALRGMPPVRRWGNLNLALLLRLASGNWRVFDPTNGYVAWRAELLRLIDFSQVRDRFLFESSMLVEIGALRGLVADVPIPARYGSEKSHLSVLRSLVKFPPFLLRATLRRIWQSYYVLDFNAVSLLLGAGILLCGFAVAFGGYHWWQSVQTGVPATAGTVILAALPLLFGFNCLLQALVLDVANTPKTPLAKSPRPTGP